MARCYVTVSSAYDIDLNTDIIPAFDLGTMDFESDEEIERLMTQIATGEATVGNDLAEEPESEALAEALDLFHDEGLGLPDLPKQGR